MKAEKLAQKCPECGCKDKRISHKRDSTSGQDALLIPHIPQGSVGVIRCSECGHLFEYCEDREPPLKVKKIYI